MEVNVKERVSPHKIYAVVLATIDNISKRIGNKTNDEKLSKKQSEANKIISEIRNIIEISLDELQKNSEWDVYTLAFYGETNAGKSTLMETLRIILNEKTKQAERERFKEIQSKYGISEAEFESIHKEIKELEEVIESIDDNLKTLAIKYQTEMARETEIIDKLENEQIKKKEQLSFFKKLLVRLWAYFYTSDAIIKIKELKKNQEILVNKHKSDLSEKNKLKIKAEEELKNKLEVKEEKLQNLQRLEKYQDGQIVGDGRPDFTREVQSYDFTIDGNKFSILDVPGIEGNEEQVKDEINSAVKKAHSIFYVTGKPTPPQSADEGKQGTLEKIKEHLSDQTEVRVIFNKRINNPVQLEKGSLISENEQEALAELDSKMIEVMKDAYSGCHVLSAQPAFLGVSEFLVPDGELFKKREKFLNKLSVADILDKSGLNDFFDFLIHNLSIDYKEKIKKANIKKINNVIMNAESKVTYLLKQSFIPLKRKLKIESEATVDSLDSLVRSFIKKIDSRTSGVVRKFKTQVTKKVYKEIDTDIKNADFKKILELTIEESIDGLVKDLDVAIREEVEIFKYKLEETLESYQKHAQGLLENHTGTFSEVMPRDFSLKIKFDNGINYLGIISSLVGGLVLIFNPAGWVLVALGIVVSIGKSVYSAFSSKFRMSQQRKITDENLDSICKRINESVNGKVEELQPELENEIFKLKVLICEPVKQVEGIVASLEIASISFKKLINQLNK